jgi:hypothetical protein
MAQKSGIRAKNGREGRLNTGLNHKAFGLSYAFFYKFMTGKPPKMLITRSLATDLRGLIARSNALRMTIAHKG